MDTLVGKYSSPMGRLGMRWPQPRHLGTFRARQRLWRIFSCWRSGRVENSRVKKWEQKHLPLPPKKRVVSKNGSSLSKTTSQHRAIIQPSWSQLGWAFEWSNGGKMWLRSLECNGWNLTKRQPTLGRWDSVWKVENGHIESLKMKWEKL